MKAISNSSLKRSLVMAGVYSILAYTILYPVGRLFINSLRIDILGKPSSWTFINFIQILSSRGFIAALTNTAIIGFFSVFFATVIGVLLAWFVARTDMPFKKFLEPLNLIPFYLSSLVGALSWEILGAPKTGILNKLVTIIFGIETPLFNVYSIPAICLLTGLFYVPYVYLFTIGSLKNMDPALEDAARMNGAGIIQTTLRVTLPLSAPAILSAIILTLILTAGLFVVPLVLGAPERIDTIAIQIYKFTNLYPPRYNSAAALSITLLVLTISLIILQRKILANRKFYTVTGKGYRPSLVRLGSGRWIALGINFLYLALTIIPFLNLVFVSFLPQWIGEFKFDRFGLENYYTVLFVNETTKRGFLNSVILATIGATLSVFFCMLLSGLINRTNIPGRKGIDFIAMLPITLPGIVLGMGFLSAWINTPIYGTIWILMLAYIVCFLPTSLKSVESTMGSISPELDSSARIAGATWFGALRRILLPIMAPGLKSTWLLLFVIFMREVSSSMMLYVFGTETNSIALYQIMDYEPQGVCAAFGSLQTLITLGAVYAFTRFTSSKKMKVQYSA